MGYSPWCPKESDMTKLLTLRTIVKTFHMYSTLKTSRITVSWVEYTKLPYLSGGGGLVVSDSCNPMDCSLSMGFSRQEYWNGLSFPSPEDLPDPGIEPRSPALQADSLPTELQGMPSSGE